MAKKTKKRRKPNRKPHRTQPKRNRGFRIPDAPQDEIMEDMLPLFPKISKLSGQPSADMFEELFMQLMVSHELADEPEFEDFLPDPIQFMQIFGQIAEESGTDPSDLEHLSADEQADIQFDLLEKSIAKALTREQKEEFLNRLNRLRRRLRGSRRTRKKTAQVAGLMSFMMEDGTAEIWPQVGVVQAVFQRSILAAGELFDVVDDLDPEDTIGLNALEALEGSSLQQKIRALLRKSPALEDRLQEQGDSVWDEGIEALTQGELYLELFSEDEVGQAYAMFAEAIGLREVSEEAVAGIQVTEEQIRTYFSHQESYLGDLFTPERHEQLRSRLDMLMKAPSYDKRWQMFVILLVQALKDPEDIQEGIPTLMRALGGEMKVMGSRERTEKLSQEEPSD